MPGESLDATLILDIADARAVVENLAATIESSLGAAADGFSTQFSEAVGSVPPVEVPVEADTSAVVPAVDAALGDTQLVLPIEADDTAAVATLAGFVGAVDGETATVTVDADTTEAQGALDELSSSADSAGSSLSSASGGAKQLGLSTGQLAGVAGLAVGEVSGLREASSLLGERTAVATTGALGLAAGVTELYRAGLSAVSSEERFNAALGDQAAAIQRVQVGTLDADLFHLGATFGSADAAMRNATTTVYQFAINSGASAPEARDFADGIAAISARAVATKPSVGDMSDVMERAAIGIGRARTAASLLNVGLSTTEVNTRAAAIAQEKGEASASAYDKSVAALQITVERFGPSLKTNVEEGAKNAANQAKAAKAEFDNALESFGKPLVAPALETIRAAIPVGEELGKSLAGVASVAIPLLTTALQIVGPLITPVVYGFAAMKAAELAVGGFEAARGGLIALTALLPIAGEEAQSMSAEMVASGAAADFALGPIGLIGLAAGAAALYFGLFDSSARSSVEGSKLAADAAKKLADQLTKTADVELLDTFQRKVDTVAKSVADNSDQMYRHLESGGAIAAPGVDKVSASLTVFRQVAESNIGTAQRLLDAQGPLTPLGERYAAILDQVVAKQKSQTAAQNESKAAADGLTASTSAEIALFATAQGAFAGYVSGATDGATATTALDDAAKTLTTDLDLLFGRFLSAQQATGAFQKGIAGLNFDIAVGKSPIDAYTSAATTGGQTILSLGQSADTASTAIVKNGGSVADAIVPLQQYRDEVQTLRDKLASAGGDTTFLDSILRTFDTGIANLKTKEPPAAAAGKAVGDAGASGLADALGAWAAIGEANAQGAIRGINSKSGDAQTAGVAIGAIAAFGVATARGGFFDAGQSAGDGVAAGLTAATPGAILAAVGVGDAVLAALKSHLKIFSPSAVFADEVGVPIAEGIADGIVRGTPAVLAAASNIAAPRSAPTLGGYGVLAQVAAQQAAAGAAGGTEPGGVTTIDRSVHTTIDARGVSSPEEVARAHQQRQVALQYLIGPG